MCNEINHNTRKFGADVTILNKVMVGHNYPFKRHGTLCYFGWSNC